MNSSLPIQQAPISTTLNDCRPAYDASVIIVSYNTREVLGRCIRKLLASTLAGLSLEVLVVDNDSKDGSAETVELEFPTVRLIRAGVNLGFAAANNLAIRQATGRYIVLLNSDAFLDPASLLTAVRHMESEENTGAAGGRLIGEDGSWQPSARLFPSLLNDFLTLSGLASRFSKSRLFGRADNTWADHSESMDVDWIPGAFSIIKRQVLSRIGVFDEAFFLYYEEVDLCRRIKAAGYDVKYWPDVVVVHLGGESSKASSAVRSQSGAQLTLWRMQAGLLYGRKHHRGSVWGTFLLELIWNRLRIARNLIRPGQEGKEKISESKTAIELLKRAWHETRGGRVSPPRPWS